MKPVNPNLLVRRPLPVAVKYAALPLKARRRLIFDEAFYSRPSQTT